MMRAMHRQLPSVAFLAVLLSCSGDSPTELAPAPAQVQATAGSGQAGVAEMPLAGELVARVTERKGKPVAGVTVSWTVAPEAGTLSSTTTITDSNGEARTRWTLGPSAGTFTVTASAAGVPPATFTATAAPAPPARVEKMAGDGQIGAPAGPLPDSLAVRVTSAGGRPVPGATVAWSVAAGGGTLGAAASTTDAGGIAKAAWTLGGAGAGTVTAGVGTLPPVAFTATAVPVATVTLSRASAAVGRGDTLRLVATPRDAAGNPLSGRAVRWSTSAPSTAAVSEAGVVTGIAYGKATVTAASEGQSASAALTVTAEDLTPPKLKGLAFSPSSVDVTSAPAKVEVVVTAADAGSGIELFTILFSAPKGSPTWFCGNHSGGGGSPAGGSAADGVWKCTLTIPQGAVPGSYALSYLSLFDAARNRVVYDEFQLRAAGFPSTLAVVNTGPPPAPPELTGLAFTPNPVNVGTSGATVDIMISAAATAGVKQVYAVVKSDRNASGGGQQEACSATAPSSGTATRGTWTCPVSIRKFAAGGAWSVDILWVLDNAGNATPTYDAKTLAAAGFPGSFQVVSPNEDVTPPTLTDFSVSPATVNVANGTRYVEFSITGTDAGSGMGSANAGLSPPTPINGITCGSSDPVGRSSQGVTFRCAVPVAGSAPTGTWVIGDVYLFDAVGNYRRYTTEQLKAAGFPSEVTVVR
jgi:hypothetical protein